MNIHYVAQKTALVNICFALHCTAANAGESPHRPAFVLKPDDSFTPDDFFNAIQERRPYEQ